MAPADVSLNANQVIRRAGLKHRLRHVKLCAASAYVDMSRFTLGRGTINRLMFSLLGYGLYGLGIVDFAGMFFGYDLTGVSWSPVAFAAAGYGMQALQLMVDGKRHN